MRRVVRCVHRVLDLVSAAFLVGLLGVISLQVVSRYVVGTAIPWSEELSRLMFVWLVFVAASRATHMSIDLTSDILPAGPRRILNVLRTILGVVILAVLIRYTFGLVQLTAYDRFTALGLSVQFLYWPVIVGGVAWIFTMIADLFVDHAPDAGPHI